MPALAAAQLVDLVVARLAPTAAGGAHPSRAWPVSAHSLPLWKVYAGDESVDLVGFDGLEQHDLSIVCEGLVAAVADLDDALHTLARDGLAALHATPLSEHASLRTDLLQRAMAQENGADVGRLTLRLRAQFHTYAAAPDVLV